ncbi:COP1-interacting protein 7 isoform X2 [Hevea brasiliensis]|uniref:COP1-interacting protein 7 isoform X2 n=1 Tax=Hevea brasiliensis TaxID=3981 RepID=UPI0025ED4BC6|nr:COP1-interacting protein 7 isoform X2 [Hevea brasiliensis]
MKSSSRLDSAVFQLTPTRTRCDLVLSANGKTDKIVSGLVNPFLAQLKIARDQMAKGGYSIILEPELGTDATWFTRGTVERFVRFVRTPEVLERVYALESEILQIEEAIAIQSNNEIRLAMVKDHQTKSVEHIEGSRPLLDSNEEKAIVLYKPGAHLPEANGSTAQEGNSKVQLMKVLETRKTVLQKEQGMAFARAVAAGFDVDHMASLMSFAESFGASRLMEACVRFLDLWKRKHENGQWVEIEAADVMSCQSDFSAMNASGIVLSSAINKQWPETSDGNGKVGVDSDEKPQMDQQSSPSQQEYFQGQFPHPMFPSWPIHSPPGTLPIFQGYPMQGIPYYQNYPGNSPFFQPPYPSGEDTRLNTGQRKGQRRHSMDSGNGNTDTETEEVDTESGKKSSRSSKKQSSKVVIRNINYITSKRQESSGSESQSASGSESDEEEGDLSVTTSSKHKSSLRSSKRKGIHSKSLDELDSSNMEGTIHGNETDGGHWQAFQSYLLKGADEDEHAVDKGMFVMEKEVRVRRRENAAGHDPLVYDGRDVGYNQEGNMTDMQRISGNLARMTKASNDESLISRRMGQSNEGGSFMDGQMDIQPAEIDARKSRYRRSTNDDFIINRPEKHPGYMSSTDPFAVNGFVHPNKDLDSSSHYMDDDSYVVSLRSVSVDQVGTDGRHAIDMDSELPSSQVENLSNRAGSQVKYEPDDLSLLPERGTEKGTVGYDPALDYDMQVHAENYAQLDKKNEEVVTGIRKGTKKVDMDRKSKLIPDTSDKKKTVGPIRKGKPSKLSPLDEAKARAERLRTFKADLQKMKKEKEEEEIKRLEALKLERQKRIAARGSSIPTQPSSQQARKQLPAKLSPSSYKGSKFSDSEPGSVSPLQKFPIRTVSAGSTDSLKGSKSNKLSTRGNSAGNRLSQSVSSLPEPKKENGSVTPDAKASMARIRRLSEPKISSGHHVSLVKPRITEPVSKPKVSNGPESKKISAIMNHDKNKTASLPELKIRTTTRREVPLAKSSVKEMPQKVNGSKSSTTSGGAELKRNSDIRSHHSDGDDNSIIEKSVVMLECEKPSIPAMHTSEERIGSETGYSSNYKIVEKAETMSNYAAIRAPVSPLNLDGADIEPGKHRLEVLPSAIENSGSAETIRPILFGSGGNLPNDSMFLCEISCCQTTTENAGNVEKELPKHSSVTLAEKPYQAPFVRVSSLEDPCTGNSEYGKAPPTSLQRTTYAEALKVHVSDPKSLKLEKIPEGLDKPQMKETSKGFRRLLKFGKKSHTMSEHNVELDNGSANGSEADNSVSNIASSSEVHTLKNLISQDETPTANSTAQKTSRHFSLLSPFRSKNSEKRPST